MVVTPGLTVMVYPELTPFSVITEVPLLYCTLNGPFPLMIKIKSVLSPLHMDTVLLLVTALMICAVGVGLTVTAAVPVKNPVQAGSELSVTLNTV